MPIESAADRLAFLSADDFGAEGVYTPVGGPASGPIEGVFDEPTLTVGFENADAVDSKPSFTCRSQDLPAGARGGDAGDTIAITGTVRSDGTYKVVEIRPDGTGTTSLLLAAA